MKEAQTDHSVLDGLCDESACPHPADASGNLNCSNKMRKEMSNAHLHVGIDRDASDRGKEGRKIAGQ
jgi:hypothetical protein